MSRRPRNPETLAKEAFSQLIIKDLWADVSFDVDEQTDMSGIDGYIGGKTLQHKYDKGIPEYNRLWDEWYGKEKGFPEVPWDETKRIAEIYIFTTGGDPVHRNINGAWAVRVTLAALNGFEKGKRMIELSNKTSMGHFVPLHLLPEKVVLRVGIDPNRYDYHIQLPMMEWPLDEYIKEVRAIQNHEPTWYQRYCAERGEKL